MNCLGLLIRPLRGDVAILEQGESLEYVMKSKYVYLKLGKSNQNDT